MLLTREPLYSPTESYESSETFDLYSALLHIEKSNDTKGIPALINQMNHQPFPVSLIDRQVEIFTHTLKLAAKVEATSKRFFRDAKIFIKRLYEAGVLEPENLRPEDRVDVVCSEGNVFQVSRAVLKLRQADRLHLFNKRNIDRTTVVYKKKSLAAVRCLYHFLITKKVKPDSDRSVIYEVFDSGLRIPISLREQCLIALHNNNSGEKDLQDDLVFATDRARVEKSSRSKKLLERFVVDRIARFTNTHSYVCLSPSCNDNLLPTTYLYLANEKRNPELARLVKTNLKGVLLADAFIFSDDRWMIFIKKTWGALYPGMFSLGDAYIADVKSTTALPEKLVMPDDIVDKTLSINCFRYFVNLVNRCIRLLTEPVNVDLTQEQRQLRINMVGDCIRLGFFLDSKKKGCLPWNFEALIKHYQTELTPKVISSLPLDLTIHCKDGTLEANSLTVQIKFPLLCKKLARGDVFDLDLKNFPKEVVEEVILERNVNDNNDVECYQLSRYLTEKKRSWKNIFRILKC